MVTHSRNSTPPRVALIGISGYGRIHLQLARECRNRGELSITAAAVINPAEEAENIAELRAHGCEIFTDYREMLAAHTGRLDLCLIPTGIHWHAPMTIAALRAGAHVLVEKPLAGSTAEVEAIRACEAETGRFVAVGFQDLYDPGIRWLKSQLQQGMLGTLRSIRFLGVWPRSKAYFARNEWAGRTEVKGTPVLDSPLNNAFGHFVMLCLYFASRQPDMAARVTIEKVELFRAHCIQSFDTAVVQSLTPEGVRLWFGVSHASAEAIEPEIVLEGDAGSACWRYESELLVRRGDGTSTRQEVPPATEARRAMLAAALKRLSDPSTPVCGSEMAARHTQLIEDVHRQGRILSLAADSLRWSDKPGEAGSYVEVDGLLSSLRRAYLEQTSLEQVGFSPRTAGTVPVRTV